MQHTVGPLFQPEWPHDACQSAFDLPWGPQKFSFYEHVLFVFCATTFAHSLTSEYRLAQNPLNNVAYLRKIVKFVSAGHHECGD